MQEHRNIILQKWLHRHIFPMSFCSKNNSKQKNNGHVSLWIQIISQLDICSLQCKTFLSCHTLLHVLIQRCLVIDTGYRIHIMQMLIDIFIHINKHIYTLLLDLIQFRSASEQVNKQTNSKKSTPVNDLRLVINDCSMLFV